MSAGCHLKVLADAGLIAFERRDESVLCRTSVERVQTAAELAIGRKW